VQYLLLTHAHAHPELSDNVGNITLLKRVAALGLLPDAIALPAADAYRELRRLQHQIKLAGAEHARVEAESLDGYPAAVCALWQAAFHASQVAINQTIP
jgi:glutamate-ammonia-ligase adenylyltransferase